MRLLIVLMVAALLAAPALADGPDAYKPSVLTLQLSKDHSFKLTVNPNEFPTTPEYMGFTITHRTEGVINETKGDPIIFLGGVKVGFWPYKHVSYVLRDGTKITGHADSPHGNPHAFEIYHADGSVTLIRGANSTKPKVTKLSKVASWVYRRAFQGRSFVIELE